MSTYTAPRPPMRLARHRWECTNGHEPVLLARYDDAGVIEIRMRERVYIARGSVQAFCPRCGCEHILELQSLTTEARA